MDIATEAKYLLCGLPALINEKTLNIIVCNSMQRMLFEKEQYEALISKKIIRSNINKTVFKSGGEILWSNRITRGYSANIIILIGLDKNSKEYKDLLPCTIQDTKIYIL